MENDPDLKQTGLLQLNGTCMFERYQKKLALKSITNILESDCFASNGAESWIISICLEKKGCFQACVIVSELDDPSGHHDFPWMALHCNFQGLVAEWDSVRDPGSGRLAPRPATRVCSAASERLLLRSPGELHISCRCSSALNDAQNLLRVQLADALMTGAGCTDVTWSHAWNSVCGGSHRRFLLVCGRLVNNIQGIWDALVLQTPQRAVPPRWLQPPLSWSCRQRTCPTQPVLATPVPTAFLEILRLLV